jgi:hypothetical protein
MSNAIGADGVHFKFLKIILPHKLSYVTHVFNTVLMSSSYPASWKLSKIMPVAKNNDPGSLSDHRPISILPDLTKAMEIIMRNQITAHIERNGMMSRLQSGFRSNHSTTTALLKIMNELLLASEEKLISTLVLLDFLKAFDSVDHQLLCSKLSCQYKLFTSAVDLIRSYLCDRMQWVWIGSQASEILQVSYRDQY